VNVFGDCYRNLILILLYIHIVTYATLDLSNYILQNYNTCTKSQNCDKHKVVIYISNKTIISIHISIQYSSEIHLYCCDKVD